MSYIVQRNDRFYVVAYNGIDPITGRERRRWYPAGIDRADAEAIRRRVDTATPTAQGEMTVAGFMSGPWLGSKTTLTHPTRNRYRWMIDHNIVPRIGHLRLDALRPADLDACYGDLLDRGGRRRAGLSPKTVLEIHRIVSNALDLAVDRGLVDLNPARRARPPKRAHRSAAPRIWTAAQLGVFLDAAKTKRLYPALHLAAHTGLRRSELAGLNWSDFNPTAATISIARTRQASSDGIVEADVKTRTSRRSIDLDANTGRVLRRWWRRLEQEGTHIIGATPMFLNRAHTPPSPESFTQLFSRTVAASELPRIRFHDLRHTHASLLVAAGVPIKVVSERLGHAHPGFTMHTYQHLIPGMGAAAANQFTQLIADSR